MGGYGFPNIITPLGETAKSGKIQENSRRLTFRQCVGVLSSRGFTPLRETAIFQKFRINCVPPEAWAGMNFPILYHTPPLGAMAKKRKNSRKIRVGYHSDSASAAYYLLDVISTLRGNARISATPRELGTPGDQGGYRPPRWQPPLGKRRNNEKIEKNSRDLTRRRRLGGVLSSRGYRPTAPLGERPNFMNPAEIGYPRTPGAIWIFPDCNHPLAKRRNSEKIQEKIAGINPPPAPRRRIIFSMLYQPLRETTEFQEPRIN